MLVTPDGMRRRVRAGLGASSTYSLNNVSKKALKHWGHINMSYREEIERDRNDSVTQTTTLEIQK